MTDVTQQLADALREARHAMDVMMGDTDPDEETPAIIAMQKVHAALTSYEASRAAPEFGPLDPAAMDLGTWTPDAAPDDVVERVADRFDHALNVALVAEALLKGFWFSDEKQAVRAARAALSAMPRDEARPPNSIPMPRDLDEARAMVLLGEATLRGAGVLPARDDAALADLALDYLHLAQPEFCSARCPSVGREGEPIPHLPECVSMRSLLDGLPFATPGATISTGLMAKLKKLANYLTEQGEYEACDLIDTVVDRLSVSPPTPARDDALEGLRELSRKAEPGEWWVDDFKVDDGAGQHYAYALANPMGKHIADTINGDLILIEQDDGPRRDMAGSRNLELAAAAVNYVRAKLAAPAQRDDALTFQSRVQPWMMACFGAEIAADKLERADRFIEEALELCQTAPGFSIDRAHALVDYVFNRPQGDINQEVGGVMVTLAAFCLAFDLDMHGAGETELARVWTKVEQIRAKQAAKPKGSALPIAQEPR